MLRAVLVAGAVIAALFAATAGQWLVVAILAVGVVGHALLWMYLYRSREQR
jgi:uncharacterized membrane protein YhhN